jgi:Fe2+ transport system protein B
MVLEHSAWLLPAAKEAYKNRDEIKSLWSRISTYFLGKKSSLAVTGMAGVGKTVLFDHLSAKAYKRGYKPPGRSEDEESGKVSAEGQRIGFRTIPGQSAKPRREALDHIFLGKKPVDGVIHVVANGFIEIRKQVSRQAHIKDAGLDTLEKFRAFYMKEDLKDLHETCEIIRQSFQKHRKPSWVLVAVTKADLFYGSIEQAEKHYSPEGDGEFSQRMKLLQSQIGSDNIRWEALPVCAWLEDFQWNGEQQPSLLKPDERDHYIALFAEQLERYCES